MIKQILNSGDPEIRKLWVAASYRLATLSPTPDNFILTRLQRLGELDCFLIESERSFNSEDPFSLSEILYLSHLWILDINEILRILRPKDDLFDQFYAKIKKIRMPLAKHEKEGEFNQYGYFAYPILRPHSNKVGWVTMDGDVFYRTDFSTAFMEALISKYSLKITP